MAIDYSKDSNYNENESFSRVLFGANAPVLEVELNEVQQIVTTKLSRLIRVFGQGVYGLADNSFNYADGTLSVSSAILLQSDGLTAYIPSAEVSASVGDSVYVRLEEKTVTSSDTLKAYGNTEGSEVTNTILDSRTPAETSRRKAITYTLMSGSSVPSDTLQYKYVVVGVISADGTFNNSSGSLTARIDKLENQMNGLTFEIENGVLYVDDGEE